MLAHHPAEEFPLSDKVQDALAEQSNGVGVHNPSGSKGSTAGYDRWVIYAPLKMPDEARREIACRACGRTVLVPERVLAEYPEETPVECCPCLVLRLDSNCRDSTRAVAPLPR